MDVAPVGQTPWSLQTPWVESPFFEAELKQRDLSPADRVLASTYHRDGYAVIRGAVSRDLSERVIAETRTLLSGQNRIKDAWLSCPAVRELAVHPDILRCLRMLYERRPIPFQTLNFEFGTQQRPHADSIHFSSLPQRFMCGVWVALEDVTADNGPLVYFPGSQQLPQLGPHDLGQTADTFDYGDYEILEGGLMKAHGFQAAEFHGERGDAFVWAANLVHGGQPIRAKGSTRWSQVTHHFFDDCVYVTPLLSNMDIGEFFVRHSLRDIVSGELAEQRYDGHPISCTPCGGNRVRISLAPSVVD